MLCRLVEDVHIIDSFMVVFSVTLPMNANEAGGNPALIRTSLLLAQLNASLLA